ncbi:fasciclin domain-containing protein [Phormidesmis sp. 146-12]
MQTKTTVIKLLSLAGVLSFGALVSLPNATQADMHSPKPKPAAPMPMSSPMTQPVEPMTQPMSTPAPMGSPSGMTSSETIVGVATANGSFKTLTAALKAAGLVETLNGSGPFTVFAPTDAAFAKLPKGTVETLLKPENKAKLIQVLTYHVVPGEVLSTSLKSGKVKTVEGSPVSVMVGKSGVMVNKSKVTGADVKASNGVIHVIDTVLMPPAK